MEAANPQFVLSPEEQEVLAALWADIMTFQELVDAPSFRADHDEWIPTLERLCRLRYLHLERDLYRPTLLGLREIRDEGTKAVLDTAARLLELCRLHYKNRVSRGTQLLVKDLESKLKLDRPTLLLHLSLLADELGLVGGSWTTDSAVPDAYISPGESVLRYRSMEDLYLEMERWRDMALDTEYHYIVPTPPARQTYTAAASPDELLSALPSGLRDLMTEIRVAAANNMRSLAVMGLRAVIDAFANEKVGDCGGFERKISEMVKRNLLNHGQAEMLRAAVEIGHATTHRLHAPTDLQCQQVTQVVEHLLRETYLLHPTSKSMAVDVPARTPN